MAKTRSLYSPELRRQLVEPVEAGRDPGAGVRTECAVVNFRFCQHHGDVCPSTKG
jgi:hypothetical protein